MQLVAREHKTNRRKIFSIYFYEKYYYIIILETGERLSSFDLNNIENIKKLSFIGLDILKYFKEDLMKVDIKKIEEEKEHEFNR